MKEDLTIVDGRVIFPDDFKDMECQTILIALLGSMSKREFIKRYFNLLPDDCGLLFYKNRMEFTPVPDKLINDVIGGG